LYINGPYNSLFIIAIIGFFSGGLWINPDNGIAATDYYMKA
jgi:hypothetical protein